MYTKQQGQQTVRAVNRIQPRGPKYLFQRTKIKSVHAQVSYKCTCGEITFHHQVITKSLSTSIQFLCFLCQMAVCNELFLAQRAHHPTNNAFRKSLEAIGKSANDSEAEFRSDNDQDQKITSLFLVNPESVWGPGLGVSALPEIPTCNYDSGSLNILHVVISTGPKALVKMNGFGNSSGKTRMLGRLA